MKKSLNNFIILLLILICNSGVTKAKVNIDLVNNAAIGEVKITILYDNYSATSNTKSDWGFACLIEGTEKTILFDTGADGNILLNNIDNLGIDLKKVDLIYISHNHGDHTGGIKSVIQRNPDLPVYISSSFPQETEKEFGTKKLVRIKNSEKICENVYSTGEMGVKIIEQSLIINTPNGLVIITGCSHQGILNVLKKAKEISNNNIYLAFGGFHLLNNSKSSVTEIINEFKNLGVQKCGATHCTGDSQINQFKEAYKENYIEMGTGRVFLIKPEGIEVK